MKVYYKLDPKFIGKKHCDFKGCIVLHEKMSQRSLRELYKKGNKFVLIDER